VVRLTGDKAEYAGSDDLTGPHELVPTPPHATARRVDGEPPCVRLPFGSRQHANAGGRGGGLVHVGRRRSAAEQVRRAAGQSAVFGGQIVDARDELVGEH
jgi:hypothetical protein